MNIVITKDSHGYLAEVEGYDYLYAHGITEQEAKQELLHVIEMFLDIHSEQVRTEKKLIKIIQKEQEYAL